MNALNKILSKSIDDFVPLSNFRAGPTLRRLRLEKGIRQKAIYDIHNVAQSRISAIEYGRSNANNRIINVYSQALNISTTDITIHILEDYTLHLQSELEKVKLYKKQINKKIQKKDSFVSQNNSVLFYLKHQGL